MSFTVGYASEHRRLVSALVLNSNVARRRWCCRCQLHTHCPHHRKVPFLAYRQTNCCRQPKRADDARTLMHILAYPTAKDMKAVLKMNSIKDCPVTEQDFDLAVQIYGPDMASLKGKATRRKPSQVVEEVVSLPAELINAQRDVVLSIDTTFVNGMAFLTTISSQLVLLTEYKYRY
jgi:hypothetical protein